MENSHALITNDAVIFGMLLAILAFVFYTSNSNNTKLRKFYSFVPMLLLCYFLPSLLNTFGIVDGENSNLYFVASRYLLPACLILLTLSVDLKEIAKLGYKPLVMFLTGTVGVILGGPLAILIASWIDPSLVGGAGPEAVWRGMTTVAGSWIGGGANQAAMYEVFNPSDNLFGIMITVDIIVAEVWMAFLLIGIGKKDKIDAFFKADSSSVTRLQEKMEAYGDSISRNPSTTDLMVMLGVAFAATAFSHFGADNIAPLIKENAPALAKFSLTSKFFWLIVIATTIGVILSFTKVRTYEGAGASKIGTIFIFILVATIGMKMDIRTLGDHPGLFAVGGIWMLFHVVLLVVVGLLIKAPYFFLAIGSKANIGGAASAPVLAAAFHPALAPVGVLLAVFGYVLGTYGAWLCGLIMQAVAP
ncbi:DUF819 family protein [Arenicella sp. 4NH20-0111]|uniref:DUF819 family protein n=1 Tax=Arenicella sp. 4NH20-0111 TaxID=3127648 RepID=UPI00310C1464